MKNHDIKEKNEYKEDKNRTILIIFFYVFFVLIMLIAVTRGYFEWKEPIPIKPQDGSSVKEEYSSSNIEEKEDDTKGNTKKVINIINEPEEEVIDPGIFSVRDENIKWQTASELKIFESPKIQKLVASNKLAPGLSSEYTYIIRNNTGLSILYDMKFEIINEDSFDIRYRLKEKDTYLIGSNDSWVVIDNIELTDFEMNTGEKKEYTLEWKWFEGSSDTQYGTSSNGKYELKTDIRAKEKTGE